jgi:hypothetical protein
LAGASLSTGRATAALLDTVTVPRIRVSRAPVIYLGGAASDASEAMGANASAPSARRVVEQVADHGFTVVSPTVTTLWGNSTCASRINDALTLARSATWGATSGKAILIGSSHGVACTLNYAVANPTLVAAIVGIIPAVDLEAIRTSDVMSLRAGIDTAWGVVYPAALPTAAQPPSNVAALSAIPTLLFYATNDTVSENVVTFAGNIGATLISLGALGHTDAAIAAVPVTRILNFLDSIVGPA